MVKWWLYSWDVAHIDSKWLRRNNYLKGNLQKDDLCRHIVMNPKYHYYTHPGTFKNLMRLAFPSPFIHVPTVLARKDLKGVCKDCKFIIWRECVYAIYVTYAHIHIYTFYSHTSSSAQGGGGSLKTRTRKGEIDCCEWRVSEQKHWPTD